jgi:uncharacterized protein (TIGR02246 family)
MKTLKPEDCDRLIYETVTNKDLEGAIALYAPNASFVLQSGEVVIGQDAIREQLIGFMALEDFKFTSEVQAFPFAEGSLALTRGTWSATAKDADGKPIQITGKNAEVVQRQPDGTWRFIIDHPGIGL